MKKLLLTCGASLVCVALLFLAALFYLGWVGDSKARVQSDHSINLPESASSIHCSGFISTRFFDSIERASFILPKDDLAFFVSQIQSLPRMGKSDTDFSEILLIPASWAAAPVISQYCRRSLDGNLLVTKILDIGNSNAGVILTTGWN